MFTYTCIVNMSIYICIHIYIRILYLELSILCRSIRNFIIRRSIVYVYNVKTKKEKKETKSYKGKNLLRTLK